jgi:hypothetical protein
MNAPTLVILIGCFASVALADDFKTITGKEYKNATVSRVEPDGIVIKTKSGISKIYFVELPKEVQARYGHDPAKIEAESAAARAAEEKRIEQEKAAEREREERREERAKTAEADLNRILEQYQVAEQRSAQAYQSAIKGTPSGQVFVSTKGGENFKLGAVEVALFARDAIDILLAGLKTNTDIKIQALHRSVGASDYISGSFYFGLLGSPIQRVETDADGKFVIQVPQSGRFVIAAQAERSVGDNTERYYWLQPVSLDGQQQLTQNLSNNNLTSTTGTSSLIHTAY